METLSLLKKMFFNPREYFEQDSSIKSLSIFSLLLCFASLFLGTIILNYKSISELSVFNVFTSIIYLGIATFIVLPIIRLLIPALIIWYTTKSKDCVKSTFLKMVPAIMFSTIIYEIIPVIGIFKRFYHPVELIIYFVAMIWIIFMWHKYMEKLKLNKGAHMIILFVVLIIYCITMGIKVI